MFGGYFLFVFVIFVSCVRIEDLELDEMGRRSYSKPTYVYRYSKEFSKGICGKCEDKHCWGVQGVSKYGNWITRSMYEKGTKPTCGGADVDGTIRPHFAITFMRRDNRKYTNVLVNNEKVCHAGDHVLRKINGKFWVITACTSYVSIFSEDDIQHVPEGIEINNKVFHYYVPKVKKRKLDGVTFSWISRNQGKEDQYIAGKYTNILDLAKKMKKPFKALSGILKSSTKYLNLKIIKIDSENYFEISVVKSFKVPGFTYAAFQVQGATRIGKYIYLSNSDGLRRCRIVGKKKNKIMFCNKHCKLNRKCGRKDRKKEKLVFQGAETDNKGKLYVGSEFSACGKPWFEIGEASKLWNAAKTCYGYYKLGNRVY